MKKNKRRNALNSLIQSRSTKFYADCRNGKYELELPSPGNERKTSVIEVGDTVTYTKFCSYQFGKGKVIEKYFDFGYAYYRIDIVPTMIFRNKDLELVNE